MNNKKFIENWVDLFNSKNADDLAELYHTDETIHQVAHLTFSGKENIRQMFKNEFAMAEMVCIIAT